MTLNYLFINYLSLIFEKDGYSINAEPVVGWLGWLRWCRMVLLQVINNKLCFENVRRQEGALFGDGQEAVSRASAEARLH
jgi:hypothetical protein